MYIIISVNVFIIVTVPVINVMSRLTGILNKEVITSPFKKL